MKHFITRNLAVLLSLLTAGSCSRQSSSNLRDQSAAGSQSSEDSSSVGLVFSSTAAIPVCSMDRKGMVIFVPAQSGVAAKECNGLGTWNTQLSSTRVTIPGSVGAVKTSTLPSTDLARCPNGKGGLLISTWDDMNFDDTFTPGIDKDFAERAVCNGDKGDSGSNSLVNNQPIAGGALSACPFGGAKLASGIDNNKNGILDLAEATVSYICNGVNGVKGAVGEKGDKGQNGAPAVVAQKALASGDAKCPSGGVALESFTDNGSLTKEGTIGAPDGQYTAGIDSNYQEPSFICNGRPVSVAIERSQNCPAGGVTLILYRDNNSNGKYDRDAGDDYISGSSLCDGQQGAPGKSSYVKVAILAPKSADCPSGGIKLESGFVGEEATAKFSPPICNGANGIINVVDSARGCGIVGGKTFQSYTDINNNGTFERDFDLNYKETEVCNGNSKVVEELMAQLKALGDKVRSQEVDLATMKTDISNMYIKLQARIDELKAMLANSENEVHTLQALIQAMILDFAARGTEFKEAIYQLQEMIKQLEALLPPTAAFHSAPDAVNRIVDVKIGVINSSRLVKYRYKIESGDASACKSEKGYSDARAVTEPIREDISGIADGKIVLCAVGANANGVWQSFAMASSHEWIKDTTAPSAPEGLQIEPTRDSFGLKWGKHVDGSVKFVLVVQHVNPVEFDPADGQVVKAGDNFGNSNVAYVGAELVFKDVQGTKDTSFHYALFAVDGAGNYSEATRVTSRLLNAPVPIQVSAGSYHSCVLYDSGVKCWGDNSYGQTTVPALVNPKAISAGLNHTCALDDSGVKCWGYNYDGEATAPALVNPKAISAGGYHTCAIDASGVKCWGDNGWGQRTVPALVNPKAISANVWHTCAIDDSGVKCWGYNTYGQTAVPALVNPIAISAGGGHTCAIDDSGVKCWGYNNYGQTTIPTLVSPKAISARGGHTCAIDDSGVKCWGQNSNGQATVPALVNPREISAGLGHTCAIEDSGVKCWGYNYFGQTTLPKP